MNNTQEVLKVKVRLIFLLGNHHNKTKGNKSYHLFSIHYFADKLINRDGLHVGTKKLEIIWTIAILWENVNLYELLP